MNAAESGAVTLPSLRVPLGQQIGARPFRDEGVDHPAHVREFADEIPRQVNDVRVDVAVDAAAAGLLLQPPIERKFRVGQPLLGVTRAEMINPAQCALVHHSFRQRDGRDAPVIMADHVDGLRLLGGGKNGFAFLQVAAQRLFAQDMFAVLQRGEGHFRVGEGRRRDVHDVNQRRLDDFAPVGRRKLPAELRAGRLHAGGIAATEGMEFDAALRLKNFGAWRHALECARPMNL